MSGSIYANSAFHCSTWPDVKDVRWGFCQSEKYANAPHLSWQRSAGLIDVDLLKVLDMAGKRRGPQGTEAPAPIGSPLLPDAYTAVSRDDPRITIAQ
jgi:hypothetical protein